MASYDVDVCRVYYQSREAGRHWTVDFGEGTPEMHVGSVSLTGVDCRTFINATAVKPVGWLFLERVRVEIDEKQASATIHMQ